MKPEVPDDLLTLVSQWEDLHRWERSQLGKALRRLGLNYGEIRAIIPVPKGTLSNWCQEVELTQEQIEAIRARAPTQKGVPKDTQHGRRREIGDIRASAREYATGRLDNASFVGGVVLYWAEGSKTRNDLTVSNTDPAALRLFIEWTRAHLDTNPEFVLSLHLHEGNDEPAAQEYWRTATGLTATRFTKSFIKPAGTGHRKNQLPHGVCRVRVCKAADHWNRVMEWIDVVRDHLGTEVATLPPAGR